MFRRRRKEAGGGDGCPYCGFAVASDASSCPQCYYDLERSPRDQSERPDDQAQLELLTLLESEINAPEDEGPMVEAVLSMDDITVDVAPFDAPEPVHEDDDVIGEVEFLPAQGPTLNEVRDWNVPEEVGLDASDVRDGAGTFVVPDHDPMADIAEPVPLGLGGLHSPAVAQQRDDDLATAMDPLPELPDLDMLGFAEEEEDHASLTQAVANETVPASSTDEPLEEEEPPALPDLDEVPDAPLDEVEAPVAQVISAPEVQHPSRWMPWTLTTQPWTLAAAQQALVPVFESLNNGRTERAAQELDHIGQHLPDDLDLLYHVGMLLKQLGRQEAFQTLFIGAAAAHPDDPRIATAANALR